MLKVDSFEVQPATIESASQDAFQGSTFTFKKPIWQSDEMVKFCKLCRNKFNQLRRKHHCRSCGGIFCNKCCLEKVPLPQFSLDTERVCNRCLPIVSCVTMSHSHNPEFHAASALGISELCHQNPALVVELGGAQTLVYLSTKNNEKSVKTLEHIADGIHALALHESLVDWLVSIGCLNSIGSMMREREKIRTVSLCDALNTLRIFVKRSHQFKVNAIKINLLPSLASLASSRDASVSLVATSIICIISESPRNHQTIVSHPGILSFMLKQVATSDDEQVAEHVLKTLLTLSTGNDDIKHSIASEDASSGGVVAKIIQSKPRNLMIICYAAGIVANLSTCQRDQLLLQPGLVAVLSRLTMKRDALPEYVLVQLIRCLANFSAYSSNSSVLLSNIDKVAPLLNDENKSIQLHTVRFMLNLMKASKKDAIDCICSGAHVSKFVRRFSEITSLVDDAIVSIEKLAPPTNM